MKVSEKYNVQVEDFIDVELERDNVLFIDPYLISTGWTDFCIECTNDIIDFFESLLNCAINKDDKKALTLISYLCEKNETRLGYSEGKANGKGFSVNEGFKLYRILKKSKAVQTGLVKDIFDCSIMVPQIGFDKISDLITNIVFIRLVQYTQQECFKLNIPMVGISPRKYYWDAINKEWCKKEILLPENKGMPILFIPKNIVDKKMEYTYKVVYKELMLPYYESQELMDPSSSLVYLLKNGRKKVSMKNLKLKYPCTKEAVENFVSENLESYNHYKFKKFEYGNFSKRRSRG